MLPAPYSLLLKVVELNTFFIKHIWPMPAEHPISVLRILTTGLMAAPSTRQFYSYITDPQCKRLGTQCWVFIMITLSELILVMKFGVELFSQTQLGLMVVWVVLMVVVSCGGLLASTQLYRWRHSKGREVELAREEVELPREVVGLPREVVESREKVEGFLGKEGRVKKRRNKARME